MATTIVPSNLVVTITESYSLNGVDYGNTMNKTYTDNGQVSQRVMSISPQGAESVISWTDYLITRQLQMLKVNLLRQITNTLELQT